MKLMFASDIHGDAVCCEKMLDVFDSEKAERLFLLGDILYHGPRNDLPENYAPKEVIKLLNARKDKLFCVRGNCDTEVDQMVLEFPILADCALLYLCGRTVFLTHGHIYSPGKPPLIGERDILICGHTHIRTIEEHGFTYINVGSVSLPKNGNEKTYLIYEDGVFAIKTLYGGSTEMSLSAK